MESIGPESQAVLSVVGIVCLSGTLRNTLHGYILLDDIKRLVFRGFFAIVFFLGFLMFFSVDIWFLCVVLISQKCFQFDEVTCST